MKIRGFELTSANSDFLRRYGSHVKPSAKRCLNTGPTLWRWPSIEPSFGHCSTPFLTGPRLTHSLLAGDNIFQSSSIFGAEGWCYWVTFVALSAATSAGETCVFLSLHLISKISAFFCGEFLSTLLVTLCIQILLCFFLVILNFSCMFCYRSGNNYVVTSEIFNARCKNRCFQYRIIWMYSVYFFYGCNYFTVIKTQTTTV